VACKVRDVLQDDVVRKVVAQDPKDVLEQAAPTWALKALLVPCLREGLAGESCAKNVVRRNCAGFDLANVAQGHEAEVSLVKGSEVFVNLAGKNATVAELIQCDVETTQPRE
jgi:hypothetical protein